MPASSAPSPGTSRLKVETFSRRRPTVAQACCAATAAGGAASNAQTALATLAADCGAAVTLVNQNPLGPYDGSGSCDSGCTKYGWVWPADYRSTNNDLIQALNGTNFTAAYAEASQPTEQWVNTDLPKFGSSVAGNIGTIEQIDAAIVTSGGNETPQQSAQLAAAFSNLTNALQSNLAEADNALQTLASFLSAEERVAGSLQTFFADSLANIKTEALAAENDALSNVPCDDADIQNFYQSIINDVTTKFGNMQPGFGAVVADFNVALKAVQAVVGVFLTIQADSKLVTQALATAQMLPPASPLRTLQLNNAAGDWNSLVQEANVQLVPGSSRI